MTVTVSIGDVAKIQSSSIDPRKYPDTLFQLYSIPGFDNDKAPEQLLGSNIGSNKSILPQRGVLFSKLNPRINRVWVIDSSDAAKRVASTEFVCLVPEEKHLDLEFLAWRLRVPGVANQLPIAAAAATKSRQRIQPKSLLALPIPLPPLDEQRRIVGILNRAAKIERLRTQAAENLREFVPALFVKMFGDPIENPMGWLREELGSLGTLDRGRSRHRPRNAPELYGGPYPFVQTGDIANSKGLVTEHSQTYSEVGLNQSRMWPAGTLCITIAANIAMTGILTFDSCFPDSVVGFQPGRTVTTEYVQTAVDLMQKQLQENAPRAAQRNINLNVLRGVNIPTPPLSLQRRYTEMIQATRGLAAVGESSKRTAATLMASLMCETCGSESSWSPHVGAADGYAGAPRGRSFDQMP